MFVESAGNPAGNGADITAIAEIAHHHGVIDTEAIGPAACIARARVVPLRDASAASSPFNAFPIPQGIETLALRLERITDNALTVARHLRGSPAATWVDHAGPPDLRSPAW